MHGVANEPMPGHQYDAVPYGENGVVSSMTVGTVGFPSPDDAAILKVLKKAGYVPAALSGKDCHLERVGTTIKLYCNGVAKYLFVNLRRSVSAEQIKKWGYPRG
jgi:hypothetical protein